jgi:hypothetical protein
MAHLENSKDAISLLSLPQDPNQGAADDNNDSDGIGNSCKHREGRKASSKGKETLSDKERGKVKSEIVNHVKKIFSTFSLFPLHSL